jgi:DNA polymerase-3 subunit gamma/tau
VVSRLQRFTFRPLPEKQIHAKLRRIAETEGRSVTDEALELIAQRAAGGMRDAESMLDQVISSGIEAISADTVRDLLGLAEMESVDRFIDDLVTGAALDGIRLLDDLETDGRDLVAFADQVVARLREQLVSALGNSRLGAERGQRLTRAARRLAGLDVNRGAAGGYRLQLELALLEGGEGATTDRPMATAQQPTARTVAQPAPTQPAPTQAKPRPAPRAVKVEVEAQQAPEAGPAESEPVPVQSEPKVVSSESKVVSSEPAPAGPVDDALAALIAAWPQVIERIGRNPADRPLINACRPLEVSGATIVLGFPENQAFMRDIAERKQHKLEEGIAEVLGRPVAVRCVATNVEPIAPQMATAAQPQDLLAQARKIFADDLADVAEVD